MSIPKVLVGTAAALLTLAGASAYAGSSATIEFNHSSSVSFSDLDLSRSRDVARLYQRIALAADKVCGPSSLTGAYSKSAAYRSCYADAIAHAVTHVNHAGLSAYYRQRWPEPLSVAQQ